MSTTKGMAAPITAEERTPHGMWMQRLHIPRERIPARIRDMDVTAALLDDYRGHEYLLQARAKHPEHCRAMWDEIRNCVIKAPGYDRATCEQLAGVYAPCAKELERSRAANVLAADDERRRALADKSRAAPERRAEGGPPPR